MIEITQSDRETFKVELFKGEVFSRKGHGEIHLHVGLLDIFLEYVESSGLTITRMVSMHDEPGFVTYTWERKPRRHPR